MRGGDFIFFLIFFFTGGLALATRFEAAAVVLDNAAHIYCTHLWDLAYLEKEESSRRGGWYCALEYSLPGKAPLCRIGGGIGVS